MRSTPLDVPVAVRRALQEWIEDPATSAAMRLRARIVVLSARGLGTAGVASEVGCTAQTVSAWRERFRRHGLDGLRDAPRSGRPVSVDPAAIIRATAVPRERGAARWSSRSLAEHLGVSNVTVANVWRAWGVRPGLANPVDLQTEPVLDRTPTSVLGVYIDSALQVAALGVATAGDPVTSPTAAVRRVGIGGRLATVLNAAGGASDGALVEFLRDLDEVAAPVDPSGGAGSLRLVVDGAAAPVELWARDRAFVGVHLVPEALNWERMVRVACLLTGTGAGTGSLEALRTAIDRHPSPGPFSWTAE